MGKIAVTVAILLSFFLFYVEFSHDLTAFCDVRLGDLTCEKWNYWNMFISIVLYIPFSLVISFIGVLIFKFIKSFF